MTTSIYLVKNKNHRMTIQDIRLMFSGHKKLENYKRIGRYNEYGNSFLVTLSYSHQLLIHIVTNVPDLDDNIDYS